MLATFVIGLREGLEAALIVGIIAAFLRNNGKSLVPMWWGVMLAVLLSIAVGVGLSVIEQALPQAQQEGMESIIGLIAVIFVTGMISWMATHARDLKKHIEADAARTLGATSSFALASMAFLAVLKEGFETSVFLLATFSAAQSAMLAGLGALAGLLAAVLIGWGIYLGSVKINMGKFFRITGAFLILVAAGLVVTSLRTAHEAGWLNAGQYVVGNLSWLAAPGTIRSALITGVLGIPADPRLIEVVGWLAYLIPVGLYVYWPAHLRAEGRKAAPIKFAIGAGLAFIACALIMSRSAPQINVPSSAPIIAKPDEIHSPIGNVELLKGHGDETGNTLSIVTNGEAPIYIALPQAHCEHSTHIGAPTCTWHIKDKQIKNDAAQSLTVDQVIALSNGRIPVGLHPRRNAGPFKAQWSIHRNISVVTFNDVLLDATERSVTLIKLSGAGLQTPRTFTVKDKTQTLGGNWQISATYRNQATAAMRDFTNAQAQWHLWAVQLPILLLLAALFMIFSGYRKLKLSKPQNMTDLDNFSRNNMITKGTSHAI